MVICVAAGRRVVVGRETHNDGADVDNGSGSEGGACIEHAEVREVRPEADVPADHNLMHAMPRGSSWSTNGRKSPLGLG